METKTKLGVPYKRGTGYVYYLGIRDDSGRKKTWFSRVFKTYEEALADSTERQKYLKQIQAQTSPNEKLKNYLADENPNLAAMLTELKTNWWYQEGENLYLHYWEEPETLDRDAVDFVVRVAPEWRIEFFSCIGNG